MDFNDIYTRELIDLRRRGEEACRDNPALAPFLMTPGADPGVERVFEAAAFLFARLRQKLDDELPEVLEPLFSLVWPHYLCQMPATSIIQYQVTSNVSGETSIPRGTRVSSIPIEGTPCHFRTIYDVRLLPLQVSGLVQQEGAGEVALVLRLNVTNGSLATLAIPKLSLFLGGENALDLYYTLLRDVSELRVHIKDDVSADYEIARFDPSIIHPLGFSKEEGMYPFAETTPLPYRILFEYFGYPEKFHFIELRPPAGLLFSGAPGGIEAPETLELHFILRNRPECYESVTADDVKLFCTPVINLFQVPDLPLAVEKSEVRIVPDPANPDHYGVYSMDRVAGWDEEEKKSVDILSDISLGFPPEFLQPPQKYRFHIRPTLSGEKTEAFLSFHGVNNELIRLDLTCTNGALPQKLSIGDICIATDGGAHGAAPFSNIVGVTCPSRAPCPESVLWRLLSDASPNILLLTDVQAFRAVLRNYHFRARHDARCSQALENQLLGIVHISCRETDRLVRGRVVRGLQTRITIDESQYRNHGEIYLFGAALNAFLERHATLYSFHQCAVMLNKSRKEFIWPPAFVSMDK